MSLTYVALGDSVAVGYRARPGEEYVARIYRYLRNANPSWRFVKLAAAGATTAALRGMVPQALATRPSLITLDIGGNDLRHSLANPGAVIPYAMRNLDWALGTLRRHTRAPIFVADVYNPLPPGTAAHRWAARWVAAFNRELHRVVARHGCVNVPIGTALAGAGDRVIARDRLHPSTAGHGVIATAFLQAGLARTGSWRG